MWVSLSKLLKLKRRNTFFLLLFYLFVFENVGNYSYYLYYFYIIINVNKSEIFSVFCGHRFCCCRCCKPEQKNSNTFTHHCFYFHVGVFLLLPQLLPFLHIRKNLLLFPFNYFMYLPDDEKLDSLKKN